MFEIISSRENGNQFNCHLFQCNFYGKRILRQFKQILRSADFELLIQEFTDDDTSKFKIGQHCTKQSGKQTNRSCQTVFKDKKNHIEPLPNKEWSDRDMKLELRKLSRKKKR